MASSWERLYSSTLGSASTTIDTGVGGIAARKYLRIIIDVVPTASTGAKLTIRFNGDTGDNYPIRRSTNGASDSTIAGTGYDYWYSGYGGSTGHRHVVIDIINVLNKEKLILHHQVVTTAGAGNAPNRIETVGKWVNTSAQITDVHIHSASFTGSDTFDPGTTMTIWGADDQGSTAKDKSSITNIPIGTRYEEVDTRKIFHRRTQTGSGGGESWVEKGTATSASALRGFASGGSLTGSGDSNIIDYVTISTLGNATDFGDLIDSREGSGACADATRCLDGEAGSIEYWTAATLSNATDFGDLSASRSPQGGGFADATRGVFAGGSNVIDYVTIQSVGNATDFGDLTGTKEQTSACADATRGLIAGGWTGSNVGTIDYITIQSTGNAGDFGDLLTARYALAATSDATRGLIGGGQSSGNVIEYVTIQTTGNSTDFGDLTVGRHKHTAYADSTRGCFVGGANGGRTNIIDYVTIQTLGNAADFGDLTRQCEVTGGCAA